MMLQGLARTDVILLLALGFVLSVVTNVFLLRKFKAYKRTPNPVKFVGPPSKNLP